MERLLDMLTRLLMHGRAALAAKNLVIPGPGGSEGSGTCDRMRIDEAASPFMSFRGRA
jgi:hypothetical protein